MHILIVELTDLELKALSTVCNPGDWAENAVKSRASTAITDIIQLSVHRCLENNIEIPSSKEQIIDLAISQGWVTVIHT